MIFEDLNTANYTTVFPVVNESLTAWAQALDGIEVDNAASICSGGEVAFFSILPRVREKLVLIDHCYGSMYHAIAKYKLVEKLGPKPALDRLCESWYGSGLASEFREANQGLPTVSHGYYAPRARTTSSMGRLWKSVGEQAVGEFYTNREKLSFLHGDLSDLAERGPFDLLYLSNAMDYRGRNGEDFRIEETVKPGGYVCWTTTGDRIRPGWNVVAEVLPAQVKDDHDHYRWTYRVATIGGE